MKVTATYLIVLIVSGIFVGGCSRAIKEGVGLGRGASGIYFPVDADAGKPQAKILKHYTRFQMGQMKDNFGGKVPARLLRLLPSEFQNQLKEKGLPNRGGKTLLVRGKILHYEAEGMMGFAWGNFEEVIARVEFVDKETGKVLGIANCIGRSKESVNRGVEKKTQGLAKAIVSWIADRYPLEE